MSQPELDVEVIGNINTTSKEFIQFLRQAPLSNNINETLDKFTLTGDTVGELKLVIPLDERVSVFDIDLKLQDNKLTTLKGAVVVENFNSSLSFHHNKITSQGVGDIREMPFNIRINTDNKNADEFSVELIHKEKNINLYVSKNINQPWRANIVSDSVEGDLDITQEEGLFIVDILNLEIHDLEGDWGIKPKDFPNSMHVKSKNITVSDYQFPEMEVDLSLDDDVLNINNLQLEGVGVNKELLNFNGAWIPGNKTALMAKAKGKKLSEFLDRLDIKEKTKGGEFDFDVRLFCECEPWNMNLENMTGLVDMTVKEGVFTNKDPNIGRILSLLNIRSMARRIGGDVSDLTDKGFSYDKIHAKLTIGKPTEKPLGENLITVDFFKLDSTSSTIGITGHSNIVEQSYNLEAQVRPTIGDAIPIATYLAGGGLTGLGIWLIDEFLEENIVDSIVDKIVEFKYQISGSWNNPIIK
jgi:uncharacterized protein YhdP